ncbi:IS3 family transposase [Mesomycoplasma dispar]|uniref:IS3 family transposase n=1 Tax=Mesomycoplasma dispar TaxID=86660 RepID=UPI0023E75BC4|nr:IS3 family transposase [Mesomycoplasma dispar]
MIEIFYELEAKCGRQKVQKMLEIKHGITLNERTIGRILSRNGLRTKTRQAKNVGK